jgi:hypothetical protein
VIGQAVPFNEAALEARRVFLDTGAGNARILIYSGTRPATGGVPAGTLLGTITLDKPCGIVNAGQLVLTSSTIPIASASGTATWARFINGADAHAFDCDVSNMAGSGEVKLEDTLIIAGGELTLVLAVLG